VAAITGVAAVTAVVPQDSPLQQPVNSGAAAAGGGGIGAVALQTAASPRDGRPAATHTPLCPAATTSLQCNVSEH